MENLPARIDAATRALSTLKTDAARKALLEDARAWRDYVKMRPGLRHVQVECSVLEMQIIEATVAAHPPAQGKRDFVDGDHEVIPRSTIREWRRCLPDRKTLDFLIEESRRAQEPLTLTGLKGRRHRFNTGAAFEEWHTPETLIEAAREVMGGIDTDPASNADAQRIVRAKRWHSKEDDGLTREWHGRVWLNPPYTVRVVSAFIDHLLAEYEAGRVLRAITLTNAQTDAVWCQRLMRSAPVFCLTEGRVKFWRRTGGEHEGMMGQLIAGIGVDPIKFEAAFGGYGIIR